MENKIENDESENENNEDSQKTSKKGRKFFAKELRQSLLTNSSLEPIKNFVQLCSDKNASQDFAMEYLESGGNCSELLRVLEMTQSKNAVTAIFVFQAFNFVLLKILSSYPEKQEPGEQACRELLNKYYSIVKSMLSLSSNAKQRRIALKLLSTMVTVSPELAKEVLVHADFDEALLKVLTQPSNVEDDKSVRTAFIHFLIAFLIEGSISTKVSFLKKRGLLGSVFNGMVYDTFETINLVLSTVQSKILEDTYISKTLKMGTFNTQVVRSLVSLYNWKGPKFFKSRKNKVTPTINQDEKDLVADCVHEFLLVLCTSHKYGVIFHDHTIGLSGKNYNSLIYTVLQSIKKPWEHKLTSELIVKICVACPDLVKYVLAGLEPFLEPRVSTNWTNIIRFVKRLLQNLIPSCVAQFLPDLNIRQIATVIEILTVPKTVLHIISSDSILHDHIGIRHESILLLNIMFESITKYINAVSGMSSFTQDDQISLKDLIASYLSKYMPPASIILSDWKLSTNQIDKIPDPTISAPSLNEHLTKVLDVLYSYNVICPQLVDKITKELDPHEFLETVSTLSQGDGRQRAELLVRAVNLLLLCDTSLFLPSSDLFTHVLPQLLKSYSLTTDRLQIQIETCLRDILIISGIFEGCTEEIMVWLYAILEENNYKEEIGFFFVLLVKKTYTDFLKYITELSTMKEQISDESSYDVKGIIENLGTDDNDYKNEYTEDRMRHVMLSPLIVALLDNTTNSNFSAVSQYVNIVLINLLHLQTSPSLLTNILLQESYCKIINKQVLRYYKNWQDCNNLTSLTKIYNTSTFVAKCSKFLITNNEHFVFETILDTTENLQWRHYYCTLLTNLVMFYLTQLSSNKCLTESHQKKCLNAIIYLVSKCENDNSLFVCLNIVLKHPVILELFNPVLNSKQAVENLCTDFILNIITELLKSKPITELEIYLSSYRNMLVKQLNVVFKKCEKNKKVPDICNCMQVIKLLHLTQNQSNEIIKSLVNLSTECIISTETTPSALLDLLCYILNQNVFANVEFTPFSTDVMSRIGEHLINLNTGGVELNIEILENSLFSYIEKYPHCKTNFSDEVFKSLIHKSVINKSAARLGMVLLKCNKKYFTLFVSELDKIIEKRELIFTLLHGILDDEGTSLNSMLEKVYKVHENILIKYLHKPQKISNYLIENYKVVLKLLNNFMNKEKYVEFVSKSHKFDVTESHHAEIITAVYRKSITEQEVSETDKFKYVSNYNTTIMNLLTNVLKKGEKTDEDWTKIEKITNLFITWINDIWHNHNYTDTNLCKNGAFQTFSKLCLKFGLQGNASLVKVLNELCVLINEDNSYLGDLFEMAVSHSEALNILLSENELKASVLNLLFNLCKKCPSVMIKAHIPVWLGSYGATLSASDQYLLRLMRLYEEKNIGFQEYRPYLWGNVATEHYSVRYGLETALWRQPKPKEILNLFEESVINNTIRTFPKWRSLKSDQRLYSKGDTNVYDPAFYLPLLSHLLVPESTIRWHQCIRRGVIGLAFIALSSEIQEIRAAACHVLSRFHSHIEATKHGKDRLLWLHLVETICRSTSLLENYHISSIVAVFLGRSAIIFTQPDHPLYIPLGNYFKARETHDFRVIPELLPLLHSVDVNYKTHRNFILQVIRDGLRDDIDLKVIFRSVAFKLFLDLHNSVLIDEEGRFLIIQILAAAVRISYGIHILNSSYSILPWLNMVLHQNDLTNNDHVSIYIDIITNLAACSKIKKLAFMKVNIIYFLVLFIDRLKSAKINTNDLAKYLKTLYEAYKVNTTIITRRHLDDLISICLKVFDCRVCNYYLKCGSEFVGKPTCDSNEPDNQACYYLKMLTLKWIQTNKLKFCL